MLFFDLLMETCDGCMTDLRSLCVMGFQEIISIYSVNNTQGQGSVYTGDGPTGNSAKLVHPCGDVPGRIYSWCITNARQTFPRIGLKVKEMSSP